MKKIKEYIREQAKNRKIGIFGTGNKSQVAIDFLSEMGLQDYVFFDNDSKKIEGSLNGKVILSPLQISKEYFILIATIHFSGIKKQLDSMGLEEVCDYICALDLEYYDGLLCWEGAPRVPELNYQDLARIEEELKNCVEVEEIKWFCEKEFEEYESLLGFGEIYGKSYNKRYRRKIMEYYCVEKLLGFENWNKGDIYVDVGASGSPYAKYLREKKEIAAWAVDLDKGKNGELHYYVQEDATRMHFKDGEISAISLQSSFEMFIRDSDIRLIGEAGRVLKTGGKLIICPLYLHNQYLSTVSPNYYHTGKADEGSLECIRVDCRGNMPFARFYSVNVFAERVIKKAKECGLHVKVYSLPQRLVEKDGFVYLKFILSMVKVREEQNEYTRQNL